MKKFLTVLAALVMTVCGTFAFAGCDSNTILVYTNAYFPPFEYFEGKNIVGVDVDIMEKVGLDLERPVKFESIGFGQIIENVSKGRGQVGAAGITITPSREEKVAFSVPYYKSIQYIIVKESVDLTMNEAGDAAAWTCLEGKKVGVQENTTAHLFIDYEMNIDTVENYTGCLYGKGTNLTPYDDALIAVEGIRSGAVDMVVIDKLPAEHIVSHQTGIKCIPLENAEEEYAICVTKGNTEILDAINKVLNEMLADVVNGENAIQRGIKAHMALDE